MHVPGEALLIKACISVTFSFKASFEVLLFYVERDNIEFCIYQSITNIVFCHDKSIRFVRIQFGVYISTPGRIKYFYGNNIFYRRSIDKIICCNFACFTCCYFSNVNSNTVTILLGSKLPIFHQACFANRYVHWL